MDSLSRTIAVVSVFALAGCDLNDDDFNSPHFIFRCADSAGCGHSDEDTIYGNGEVFGTVYMNRKFEVYYGTLDAFAWSEDGGINEYLIDAADDVEVIAGSPYRLGSYQPFSASEPGLSVIIAVSASNEVIDYMYINARPGPATTIPHTSDTDTEEGILDGETK